MGLIKNKIFIPNLITVHLEGDMFINNYLLINNKNISMIKMLKVIGKED